jgi:regulator of cell morphogenesis and NO signaling
MSELLTKSLAQIVQSNHQSAAVFEKYHLDFCCKGKRPLWQACTEQQVPVDEIVVELENVMQKDTSGSKINFDKLSLTQLSDYIIGTHHVYVKQELPQIFAYLQRVASKHGSRHPEMLKVFDLFTEVKDELEQHMQKEEMILFPRIKELEHSGTGHQPEAYLQAPIAVMEHEHDKAGRLLEEIRILTADYNPPADACTTYRLSFAALKAFEMDLHQHVHLENNILFPKALAIFTRSNEASLN